MKNNPYRDLPSFPVSNPVPPEAGVESPPVMPGAKVHLTEMVFPLYDEGCRFAGDQTHELFERNQSGNLSDAPDDGGPRAVPSPPARLR